MYPFKREKIPPQLFQELKEKQKELRKKVKLTPVTKPIKYIVGCDSAFVENNITLVFVIFSFPELTELEVVHHMSPVSLPYVPGFLAFREVPNLLLAFEKLSQKPDLIMVDGQGIMHPRGMGIATHLGVLLNTSTIGIAKKKLIGQYKEPENRKGSYAKVFAPPRHSDEGGNPKIKNLIGFALRPKDKVKPIFVSPGHLCSMDDSLSFTLETLVKHKLPEPTRIADIYSKKLKN